MTRAEQTPFGDAYDPYKIDTHTWSARIPAEHALRQGSRAVELLRSRYAVVTAAVALQSQSGLRRSMRAVFGVFVSAALSRYG